MLNTWNEENITVFYSYLACFVNTVTLNMYVSMSYTGLTKRTTVFIFLCGPQEFVNIYSTRRVESQPATRRLN